MGHHVSYDLAIIGDRDLDLDVARNVLGVAAGCDEVDWLRDALTATVVLTPDEIGVGISANRVPAAERARDFEQLLHVLLDLAEQLGAELHDEQFGRGIGRDDLPEVVRFFG